MLPEPRDPPFPPPTSAVTAFALLSLSGVLAELTGQGVSPPSPPLPVAIAIAIGVANVMLGLLLLSNAFA